MNKALSLAKVCWLPAMMLSCAAARLGMVWFAGDQFALGDDVTHGEGGYDVRARNLLATGVLGVEAEQLDVESATVLYPLLLAVAYAIGGRSHLSVSGLNLLFDLITMWAIFQLGKRLFGQAAIGGLAALFFAFYPYLIFQSLSVAYTSLLTMLLSLTTLSFVVLRERERWDGGTWAITLVCGVLLGLLALTRPPAALIAFGAALWFLLRLTFWQSLRRLVPVALMSVATIAPWLWHTHQTFNRFIPIGGNLGVALWGGNSPYTVPFIQAGYSLSWLPEQLEIEAVSGQLGVDVLANRERLTQMAIAYLRENLDQLPRLLLWKFYAQWTPDIFPSRNPLRGVVPFVREADGSIRALTDPDELRANGFNPEDDVYNTPLFRLGRWVHRFYFGGLLLLALVGMWQARSLWRHVSLIGLVLLSLTLFHVLTTPYTRYRAPSDPLLFLFSAYALLYFWQRRANFFQTKVKNA